MGVPVRSPCRIRTARGYGNVIMRRSVPEKPTLDGLEEKWSSRWEETGTYHFDRDCPKDRVYSIDTPPPTVSGSLHIGHVYSYTHADIVARYKRMSGMHIFYPVGWDDNGVPTERRVENYYGVRCDPTLPEDPSFEPADQPPKDPVPISRPDFIRLCQRLTAEDEKAFEELWRKVGLSVDWRLQYTTIGPRAQKVSQAAFVRLLTRGQAYSAEAPTLWDVDFQTAVSQAELEDRDIPGQWHRIAFTGADGTPIEIQTTRPELLAACVALVAHPDDSRYADLFGTQATTPLFGASVPIVAHELADPEKGTGMAMICTFGDTTDVTWWRDLGLPIRAIIGRNGRLVPIRWGEPGWECANPAKAQSAYDRIAGKAANGARIQVVEMLSQEGALLEDPRPISHAVKFYEKGRRPLEIVTSRQWFLRVLDHRESLLARGSEINWHPPFMRHRFDSWVEGLASDWNISRQRYFGVPFPIWYPLDQDGNPDYANPIVAPEESLPVDPSTDVPTGYQENQRGAPGGFIGDPDVLDTWATSSLTPQIAGDWLDDPELFAKVFPMDLRPQGQDIIRTWLFYTVVRSDLEHQNLPWSHTQISGFIVDPDRKKMSKSKGNVITPAALLDEHGTDAIRYWAASGRPGMDTVADAGQMKVGRRLAIKLLNASRFALLQSGDTADIEDPTGDASVPPGGFEALDKAMLAKLAWTVGEATAAMEAYDYTKALERTEAFFWSFCDDYLELVKRRAYGEGGAHAIQARDSARAALLIALSAICRLFAPIVPFVTEEIWSWWHEGSVHTAPWPDAGEIRAAAGADASPTALEVASEVLGQIRRAKTEARKSMRAPVRSVHVADTQERLAALALAAGDLSDAGLIEELTTELGEASVMVHLAD